MRKKCLVVEDVPMIRRIIEMMMGRFECEVSVASDGAMALSVCKVLVPDLILLDWAMPNMDGLTFVSELRRMQAGNKPKIVMCTVKSRSQHSSMAMAAGVDEYIEKPFNIEKLTEVLMRLGFC